MKILFHTNIDAYMGNVFPTDFTHVPRIGEKVRVKSEVMNVFQSKKLPTRLEVVDVEHSDVGIFCELWYNDLDRRVAEASGAKTL